MKNLTKNTIQGTIFNIQRFSIHDGPGIRTLVFMKGCPLRCRWCSNPEGLTTGLNILSNTKTCIGCGFCAQVCRQEAIYRQADGSYQIDRARCINCLACGKVCPTNAKKVSGEVKTVAEVLRLVEKDQSFYRHSGGGVTGGGGEMLMQPEFTHELLRLAKEQGIDTAVETSGYGSQDWLLKIADQCGTVHFDIKAMDPGLHKQLTRVDNRLILDNLIALSDHLARKQESLRARLIVRMPLINGSNTMPEEIRAAARFIREELSYYTCLEVLAFHNFGEKKYEELGLRYEFAGCSNTTAADLAEPIRILQESGITLKVPKW